MKFFSWNMLELWCPGFGSSFNHLLFLFSLPYASCVFLCRFMYQRARKLQEIWHNFDPDLLPRHGVCQGTSNPKGLSALYNQITKSITILRVLFWLGGAIGSCRGRGWDYQCIISSMETLLMSISSPCSFMFVWCRRVLIIFFLILNKFRIARGLPCT